MTPLREVYETEEIIPPEAHAIADAFRREARRARDLAAQSRSIKSRLDYNWQGNSKNKFSGDFDPQIGQLENYANALDEKARQIENIRVKVQKKKWIFV
ncbi:MAG: hypothetical protein VB089_04750 [Anaerolineaceae bacterium]|nr:hypothetical protein [Anaerolineaceae bacterium]